MVRHGFYERFFPIFTLLFGLGFAIFLESAGRKTDSPRKVLARRLLALAVIGVIHQLFHQGEALLPYAVFGLVFLLPSSFLRPWPVTGSCRGCSSSAWPWRGSGCTAVWDPIPVPGWW